jgi:hypothetical protein
MKTNRISEYTGDVLEMARRQMYDTAAARRRFKGKRPYHTPWGRVGDGKQTTIYHAFNQYLYLLTY